MKRNVFTKLKKTVFFTLALFLSNALFAQTVVSGIVLDNNTQSAVAGVSVFVKGANLDTMFTDNRGHYQIVVPEKRKPKLVFYHPNYKVLKIAVKGQEKINVLLKPRKQKQVADQHGQVNQYGQTVKSSKLIAEAQNGILVLRSEDGQFKYWLDNRIYFDGAKFFGEPLNPIGDGVAIRRARFAVKGILWKNWYGEIDLDFAGSQVELKDAYAKYMFHNGFIKAGNFKESFSMETTTTSRYVTFIERSLSSKFAPSRHLGIAVSKWGTYWLAIAGVHFNDVGGFEEAEKSQSVNKKIGKDEGISYTGRLAIRPINSDGKLIHLGVAGSYRTPKTSDDELDSYRFSTRSLTSINRKKYIDTDDILDVNHNVLLGGELALAYNNIMIQGEYTQNTIYRNNNLSNVVLNGFYGQIGWLIFGSKYRYNTAEGEFTRANLKNDWGDIELAVRYSYVNANDKEAAIFGGEGEGYTVGLNYLINSNVKLMINYNMLNHDRYANGKGKLYVYKDGIGDLYKDVTDLNVAEGEAGDDFSFISARLEIDF